MWSHGKKGRFELWTNLHFLMVKTKKGFGKFEDPRNLFPIVFSLAFSM